jgi:hypothetical protein
MLPLCLLTDISLILEPTVFIQSNTNADTEVAEDISEAVNTEQLYDVGEIEETVPLRKSQRVTKTPSHLQDYVCASLCIP